MKCLTSEEIAYNQKLLDIAQALEYNTTLGVTPPICNEDFRKAKRYQKLLVALTKRCCPNATKQKLINQLNLSIKD